MAKTKRLKSGKMGVVIVKNWEQIDAMVESLGSLRRKIDKAESDAQEEIDRIKAKLAKDIKTDQAGIYMRVESIKAFAAAWRKYDFGAKQTKKLNHGTIGWRKSTVISIKKTTVALIKQVFGRSAKQYIHVKEMPDKEAMAKLTDEQLAAVGARRKHKDVFFVEPDIVEAADHG